MPARFILFINMKRLLLPLLVLSLLFCTACAPTAEELPLTTIRDDILHSLSARDAVFLTGRSLYSYYGIEAEDCADMAAYQLTQGLFPDECVMIRAVNKDAAKRVEAALQQRLQQVLAQSRDYDAEGYAMAQSCRVETDGLYLRFFLSQRHEEMEAIYQAYRKGESRPLPPAPVTPTPKPTPTPVPTPTPTPEATPVPWPSSGKVPETPRADHSWFDDVIWVGDSVEMNFNYYVNYERIHGRPELFGKATFFAAPNFSWHLAIQPQGPQQFFPVYNGQFMTVEDAVVACGAKKVLIGMGVNDVALIGLEKTMEYVDLQLTRIVEKAPEATIYLMGMIPRPAGYDNYDISNALIREFNGMLLRYAEEHGHYYLDSYEALADEKGELPYEHCADPEGLAVHPSFAGCAVWLDYLYTHAIPDEE